MDIGFIGLGRMGLPMARNLVKAGHRVVVWDRTRGRSEELRDEGAEIADSPAGACQGEIVITMLANDDAVEEVVLGSGRVISALRQNAIHLSMSTISVALSEELTEVHHAAAQDFVAAPVFGRPEAAAAGKLFIVAAGEHEPVDSLQAAIRRPRAENIHRRSVPAQGQPGKAERQFPGRLGHRVPGRGNGADPEIQILIRGAFSRS
jgi:3-hydroxyisobutyrate dehydrogenase-like beta-hydroxyacid dehydrogenase